MSLIIRRRTLLLVWSTLHSDDDTTGHIIDPDLVPLGFKKIMISLIFVSCKFSIMSILDFPGQNCVLKVKS